MFVTEIKRSLNPLYCIGVWRPQSWRYLHAVGFLSISHHVRRFPRSSDCSASAGLQAWYWLSPGSGEVSILFTFLSSYCGIIKKDMLLIFFSYFLVWVTSRIFINVHSYLTYGSQWKFIVFQGLWRPSSQWQCVTLALCSVAEDAFLWPPGEPREDGAGGIIPFYRWGNWKSLSYLAAAILLPHSTLPFILFFLVVCPLVVTLTTPVSIRAGLSSISVCQAVF